MRYNIKGRWQPGHQWGSFHWSIVYIVVQYVRALKMSFPAGWHRRRSEPDFSIIRFSFAL